MMLQTIKDYALLALALVAILQSTYTLGATRPHPDEDRILARMETPRVYRHIFKAGLPETCVGSTEGVSE